MTRHIRALVAAAVLFLPGPALALDAGTILTNFAYAEFELMSGQPGGKVVGGYNEINVPNSQSAWVLITDAPQLCLVLFKTADDGAWNPQTTVVPGGTVCFTISFSNCGNISVEGVTLTDKVPANTVRTSSDWSYPEDFGFVPRWATGIDGPWNSVDMIGQEGPFYIRWSSIKLGIGQSAYIGYCVDVL